MKKKFPLKQVNGKVDEDNIDLSTASKEERAAFFSSMAIESLSKASVKKKTKK